MARSASCRRTSASTHLLSKTWRSSCGARQIEQETLVLISQFGLVIRKRPLTSRVPDLAMFLRKNIVEQDGYIHSAPELVVEVLVAGKHAR